LDYKTVQLRIRAAATAKEALLLAQERYRVGATAYIDLSTALDQYQNAENQTLIAIYTYHRDFAALEAAIGRPLR
jgi:outer membrane protein TolC